MSESGAEASEAREPGLRGGRMELSERLRELRKARGFTQEKLARLAGENLNTINNIERRRTLDPHLSTLINIAKGLDMSVSELLKFQD